MALLFRFIARLFILGFAYIIATLAGIATLAASIMMWRVNYGSLLAQTPEEEIVALFFDALFLTISSLHILTAAFIPASIAALLTESLSLRSFFIHVALGGLSAFYILTVGDPYKEGSIPRLDLLITLASGFVAGFFYWLIAGRSAGRWHTPHLRSRET